ncbi:U-box domain-containing protein 52-like [Musa acuminata AAA Group]|uniref:U-box domain-containing protein 52-like n=1 Tax=Musa acuminata AAA Group TaxID=214697 RepID=UPI0031D30430
MYTHRSSGRLEHMHVDAASPLVAVAIDKDKGSQNALKWAAENLVTRGHTLTLIHVNVRSHSTSSRKNAGGCIEPMDHHTKELFLPFRCFCTRKNLHYKDVVLGGHDVAKTITEFVSHAAIEKLVVGAPSKGGLMRRFKHHDITTNITKGAPDFCTVYVIAKGKVSAMKNATRLAPIVSPLRDQIQSQVSLKPNAMSHHFLLGSEATSDVASDTHSLHHEDSIKSPYAKVLRGSSTKSYADTSFTDTDISFVSSDTDISFVSSGRPSNERSLALRLSSGSEGIDNSFEMVRTSHKSVDPYLTRNEGSTGTSWSSQTMEDVEEEMKRLRLELKHTMDMYNKACKEALTAKQKAMELQRWKIEEEKRLYEAHMAEEAAMASVERERAKCRAAIEAAQAEHRLAELEAQKRIDAEMKAIKEAEVMKKALDSLAHADVRYRKYAIEEIEAATEYFADHHKIGEGGYGSVYKCYLDHTAVAVKVLRPDAAQSRSQFHQEVEILSCIRHPNMVLLLGACPEYGCLVYEYMANGSLEDRLFRRGNTPVIPWQYRFQIVAEIATCLLFLHHKKPEPLVHQDLKPGNILLDKYYVSKISDVGLARLVPPSVANSVTQYRMTSTAGTFYYIDPEYQQTGMLGVKSDIYSLGILLLQIITAKPPAGLTRHVSHSIEKGTFDEMLDAEVTDWPVEEAQRLAEIALKCTELRRKDRPDLERVVLPELERLRSLAEDNMLYSTMPSSTRSHSPSIHSRVSPQDIVSDSLMTQSGYESSSESSATGR